MASRKKLGSFLSSIGVTENHISYSLKRLDGSPDRIEFEDDLRTDPVSGKKLLDLTESSDTGLIGDYVRYVMENFAPNEFMLKGGNAKAAGTNKGDSLQEAESAGAERVFVESDSTLGSKLYEYSNSGKYPSDIIDKTEGT